MLSHQYRFPRTALVRTMGLCLVGLGLVSLLVAGLRSMGGLGRGFPVRDMDTAVLWAKADLAGRFQDVEIVLVGDSSCLMDVRAVELAERLNRRCINLGTFSHLGLQSHARLVSRARERNPIQWVVLLCHPEALRRASVSTAHDRFLQEVLEGRPAAELVEASWDPAMLLGISSLNDAFLNRLFPAVLKGGFGPAHGHVGELLRVIHENGGSLGDPHRFDPASAIGRAEFRIGRVVREEAGAFRASLGGRARLAVGLTPLPVSVATSSYTDTARDLARELAGLLGADHVLTNLPAVLQDDQFASSSHLTPAAARDFTAILASQLDPVVVRPLP
ncbi:MAG: hypothetical protein EXS36_16660 [Pedosphaera sp.]|nr:hypothetical protein [Pedosphaera sp.]